MKIPSASPASVVSRSSVSSSAVASSCAPEVSIPVAAKQTSRKRGRAHLPTLVPSDVDHGFSIGDFHVGLDVLVFFKDAPIAGTIEKLSTRSGTCTVHLQLETDMYDQMVTVSCRCMAPLADFNHDSDADQ